MASWLMWLAFLLLRFTFKRFFRIKKWLNVMSQVRKLLMTRKSNPMLNCLIQTQFKSRFAVAIFSSFWYRTIILRYLIKLFAVLILWNQIASQPVFVFYAIGWKLRLMLADRIALIYKLSVNLLCVTLCWINFNMKIKNKTTQKKRVCQEDIPLVYSHSLN